MVPELVDGIFDQLNKSDQQSPRMRAVHDQSFQKYASDLLLNCLRVGLGKQMQHRTAEVVRVAVGIAQLVRNRIQEQIATLRIQVNSKILEDIHVGAVCYVRGVGHKVFVSKNVQYD